MGDVWISLGHDGFEARRTHSLGELFRVAFLAVEEGRLSWLDKDFGLHGVYDQIVMRTTRSKGKGEGIISKKAMSLHYPLFFPFIHRKEEEVEDDIFFPGSSRHSCTW